MSRFLKNSQINNTGTENNEGVAMCAADTAGAENENKAAAAYGKFADAQALLSAYLELEAEFTRRSQRLKELEKGNKARSDGAPSAVAEAGIEKSAGNSVTPPADEGTDIMPENGGAAGESIPDDSQTAAATDSGERGAKSFSLSEETRRAVIEEYLSGVLSGREVPVISGGIGVAAPKNTAKTVSEAGRLARRFLDG